MADTGIGSPRPRLANSHTSASRRSSSTLFATTSTGASPFCNGGTPPRFFLVSASGDGAHEDHKMGLTHRGGGRRALFRRRFGIFTGGAALALEHPTAGVDHL